ncbi:hypothetical protein ACHHYP_03243 [Achlya hypogyna]|uniref:Cyclic nucleotide-binding domain-containing protein n=1 Tax=Achlya hypogyna TaxID=1202772 RepID=A0A1V9ZRH4_ACHHY|nr:hypothetical protein ACHHYP_03243 [Achlya hypogyna]
MADAPFPSLGVSCAFLVAWKDDMIAQGRISATATTTEVCDTIVKPATLGLNQSYAETVGAPGVGTATHFVSHAWKYCFVDLVAAIEIYALSVPDAKNLFFWVDLMVVDQHNAPSRPHTWWSTTFVSAIRDMGKVVMVFSPLLDPVPLTRAWCLWEIFSAITAGAEITLAMPTEQWTLYRVNLREDYHGVLDMLVTIDGRRAEAFNPDDRAAIFSAVEATTGGFDALNGHVRKLIAGILLVGVARHSCQDGNLNRLQDILRLEPDLDTVSTFMTPLGVAADMNSPLIADFLLGRGARVDARMGWGHTALHVAARAGHADLVRLLLLSGANATLRNDAGRTPREEAAHVSCIPAVPEPVPAAASGLLEQKFEQLQAAVDAAHNALRALLKHEALELKAFARPPAVCATVMKCLVLILGLAPAPRPSDDSGYWEIGKRKLLSNPNFVDILLTTDFATMLVSAEPGIADVLELAADPALDPTNVECVNRAMWACCLWVRAYILAHSLRQDADASAVAAHAPAVAADAQTAQTAQGDHARGCLEPVPLEESRKTSLATQFEIQQANDAFTHVVEINGPAVENCRRLLRTPPAERTLEDVHVIKVFFHTSKIGKYCSNLDPHKETEFYKALELMTYDTAEAFVFHEGDVGDRFYVILSGRGGRIRCGLPVMLVALVQVRKRIKNSDPPRYKVACELEAGECFGDRALVGDGEDAHPREASVVTLTPVVELATIGKDAYAAILREKTKDMYLPKAAADISLEVAKRFRSNKDIVRTIFMQPSAERSERDLKFAVEYLKGVKFFSRFSFEVRKLLCKALRLVCAWTNTTIFQEGQTGHHFYILFSGAVEIRVTSRNRHNEVVPMVVANLKEGETFGELALSEENGTSTDYSELLTLSRDEYIPLVQKYQHESHAEYVRLLQSNPTFCGPEWDASTIEAMCSVMVEKYFPFRSEICKQGSRAVEMYVVVRGECVAKHHTVDPFTKADIVIDVARYGPNSVMGCAETTAGRFNDIFTRHASIYAESPVKVLVLSRFDVFHLLSADARSSLQRCGTDEQLGSLDNRVLKTIVWEKYRKDFLAETLAGLLRSSSKPSLDPLPKTMSLDGRPLVPVGDVHVYQKPRLGTAASTGSLPTASARRIHTSSGPKRTSVTASRSASLVVPAMSRSQKQRGSRPADVLMIEHSDDGAVPSVADDAADEPLVHFNPLRTPAPALAPHHATRQFLWTPIHGVPHPFALVGYAKPCVDGAATIAFRVCGKFKDIAPTLALFQTICAVDAAQPPTGLDCTAFDLYKDADVTMVLRNQHLSATASTPDRSLRRGATLRRMAIDARQEKAWKEALAENHAVASTVKAESDPAVSSQRYAVIGLQNVWTHDDDVHVNVYHTFPTPQSAIRHGKHQAGQLAAFANNALYVVPLFEWIHRDDLERYEAAAPHAPPVRNMELEHVLDSKTNFSKYSGWRARKEAVRKRQGHHYSKHATPTD